MIISLSKAHILVKILYFRAAYVSGELLFSKHSNLRVLNLRAVYYLYKF